MILGCGCLDILIDTGPSGDKQVQSQGNCGGLNIRAVADKAQSGAGRAGSFLKELFSTSVANNNRREWRVIFLSGDY